MTGCSFVPPRPKRWLIRGLEPVNRVVNLHGVRGLRRIAGVNHIPGVAGVCKISAVDLPDADSKRITECVRPDRAVFITPNHPEFYADWMIDKEILSRTCPMAACWAAGNIVNGMGRLAQRFWLSMNLVAQVPGAGAQGKAYSCEWARAGHGVLLHPEGDVGWHSDLIGKLFSGAMEMALEVAEHPDDKPVFVVPVVWKLRFVNDVEAGLHRELDYVQGRLGLAQGEKDKDPAQRVFDVYSHLLRQAEHDFDLGTDDDFWSRQRTLIKAISERIARLVGEKLSEDADEYAASFALLKQARRQTADAPKTPETQMLRTLCEKLRLVLRFRREFYTGSMLTQEQVAESIKRIRHDYLKGNLRDTLNKFVPRPVGPRIAHIRVAEPIKVKEDGTSNQAHKLTTELRETMQSELDGLNAQLEQTIPSRGWNNPFR